MFNPTSIVSDAFLNELVSHYESMFDTNRDDIQRLMSSARNVLDIIANSNALYHDANHTIIVTVVGTEILRGKMLIEGDVTPSDWVHFVVALLHHDIGYVRGICKANRDERDTINSEMETIAPPVGSTDAFLTPYHVDRAKLYMRERYGMDSYYDVDVICANIERTRFPVPSEEDHMANDDLIGLLRAAYLIGRLADPHYFGKISGLFTEFRETGQAAKIGYTTAAEL